MLNIGPDNWPGQIIGLPRVVIRTSMSQIGIDKLVTPVDLFIDRKSINYLCM